MSKRKPKPEYVQAYLEATSLKAALKFASLSYGDEITAIFTKDGFSFSSSLKQKGKQMHAEFWGTKMYDYQYGRKNEDGTPAKDYAEEYAIKFSAKAFAAAGPVKSALKKKTCRFHFEVDIETGQVRKKELVLVFIEINGRSPIAAEWVSSPPLIENIYKTVYSGGNPNSNIQAERFGEFMTSGCGKSRTVESLEFILTSNSLIHYIAKNYKESFISSKVIKPRSKKRADTDDEEGDDTTTTSEDTQPVDIKSFTDNSCLSIITPIQLKHHPNAPAPSPVFSVSFSADECPQYAALTKVNSMAAIQVYLRKDFPLVLQCPLGTHGEIIFTYVDVSPDKREKAAKTPVKKRPVPTKLPKRRRDS